MNMMANLGRVRLQGILTAGLEVLRIQQALAARRSNLVAELLHGEDEFFERRHYPAGDIYDPETGAQYYYHAHRSDPREHGHFHIFQRPHVLSERFERSEEHTSELQSLMRISYAVFCLKKKQIKKHRSKHSQFTSKLIIIKI